MASAAELVNSTFSLAQTYASAAESKLTTFTDKLANAFYTAPTVSVEWVTPGGITLDALPDAPDMPAIEFNEANLGTTPNPLSEDIPEIDLPEFTDELDALVMPERVTVSYGATPAIPAIREVAIPNAPTIATPAAPTYLGLSTITTPSIDLREGWLNGLGDVPTLSLLAPTPYSYTRGAEYASVLLDGIKSSLTLRLEGGTGLPVAVEQAIWDRARSRETKTALANEAEVMRASEAMGFQLPSGVLAAQLREAQQNYYDKLSGLSRDVAIKQAEMEQENLKQTIAQGMQLESQLTDYSYKMEQLTFESAKFVADNAIQVHNAALDQFKALLQAYEAYASVYKTIIDAQLAKAEVYKAQLQGEQAKADVNQALVQQYKAEVEAGMAQVEIYKAQVGAANTLVQLEQAKIGAAGEQIRAFVAQVNAETSKVEAYKAGVHAEATKVEIYKTKAEVYSVRVNAQAEKSRALVARYSALAQAKAGEWGGYQARISAESTRIEALGKQSGALLDKFRAETAAIQAKAEMNTQIWTANMKQYEAGTSVALQAARINNDAAIQTNNARLDAAKAGTQVYAQLTASSYGMMHAQAGISGQAQMSIGYNYKGEVSGSVSPITSMG